MSGPAVSVVVPVRNAGAGVSELLRCLADQDLAAERRETIVVDDGSTDSTAQAARDAGATRVLSTGAWRGAYAARNLALGVATGEVIAFTDGDCRPTPTWLSAGLEELDRLELDVLVGHVEVPLSARPGPVELLDFCRYLDQRRAVEEAGFGATANLFVRRRVFDAVGPFLDDVISVGDRELCQRAAHAGFALAYSPRPVVVHAPRRRAYDLARRGFRDGFGHAQMQRHREHVQVPQVWRRPGAYVPSALIGRASVYGIERLDEVGRRPTRRQRLALALVEWTLAQLPMVVGNAFGAARERLRS